jgi:hypothetical protein
MRKFLIVLVVAVLGVAVPWAVVNADVGSAGASHAWCPKVILYNSRGSGQEAVSNSPGSELFRALRRRYGTGKVGEMENGYPAVRVTFPVLGRKIPNLRLKHYLQSVRSGVTSARLNVADLLHLCRQSYLVLAGYSQGAQVTRGALAKLDGWERERVAAIVLFGDPFFDSREKKVVTYFPGGRRRRHGILARRRYPRTIHISSAYAGRTFSWCHWRDFVCQGFGPIRKGQHGNYVSDVPAALHQIGIRLARLGIGSPVRSYPHFVVGTCNPGACALATWSGPGTTSTQIGAVDEGQRVNVTCQAVGEVVTGANGRASDIWDQLSDGAFVADFYIDTPGVGTLSPPIPSC